MLPDLLCGDILQSTNPGLPAKVIRFFGRLQTGKAVSSHSSIGLLPKSVIESLWRVRINPSAKYDAPGFRVAVYRLPLTDAQRDTLRTWLLARAGDSYGWTKLPLFALDGLASWLGRRVGRRQPCFWFTAKLGVFNVPVCSQLYVYGLRKVLDYSLMTAMGNQVDWRTVSPDYLDDLLKLQENRAQLIYETTGINSSSFISQPVFEQPVSLV